MIKHWNVRKNHAHIVLFIKNTILKHTKTVVNSNHVKHWNSGVTPMFSRIKVKFHKNLEVDV